MHDAVIPLTDAIEILIFPSMIIAQRRHTEIHSLGIGSRLILMKIE
jgi:hypothetical protein